MKYESITSSDVNNGLGCRVTLWISGCTHHCKQCHNRKTWSFSSGKVYNGKVEEVLFNEIDKPYIKGFTLSGGDPLDSPDGVLELLQHFREILELSDILVDGMYDCTKRDISLAFRGSSNQRIIDLKTGEDISSKL